MTTVTIVKSVFDEAHDHQNEYFASHLQTPEPIYTTPTYAYHEHIRLRRFESPTCPTTTKEEVTS